MLKQRPREREIHSQRERQREREIHSQRERESDGQIGKQTDSETKDIDRKTSRQTVKQKILTERQTDRQ